MNVEPGTGRSPYAARKHDHHNPLAGGKVVPSKALAAAGEPSSETFLRGDNSWAEIPVAPVAAPVASGFDPTKDPIVIGHNAFSNGTSTGALTGEIAIGRNADAEAQHAVAIGDTAQVYWVSGVAIGYGAVVNEQGGVALGHGSAVNTGGTDAAALAPNAVASGDSSVAVGAASAASGTSALAIGASASATHLLASAIGNNAATTKDRQHMIGTSGTFVEIPGDSSAHPNGLVLTDTATGTRYIVQITSGALVLNAAP